MKTEKDFIYAVDELIIATKEDSRLNSTQKIFCITSLNVLRLDIKEAFENFRTAKRVYKNVVL